MFELIFANWRTSLAGATAIMILLCDTVGVEIPAKQELLALILGILGLTARDAK